MRADEFKIKVTNIITGEEGIMTLADLRGYEGEVQGVFIECDTLPNSLKDEMICSNKDRDGNWINDNLDFEPINV